MTKSDKNKLIHDLIKEDPETTIKDYLQLLCEIANIAATGLKTSEQKSIAVVSAPMP